jgi:hypothetical protein
MGEEGTPKTEMINPALLDGVSANFIVKGPSGVEKSYPMRQITMTIGRSDQCDISVKDSSMSGRHCEVQKISGEIRVKDLGSANGIWLNGERITDAELFDGDVIRCGQTSIRVDVVGGKKRPDAGMNPKMLAALIAGFVVVLVLGIGGVLMLKRREQHKKDLAAAQSFIKLARENQQGNKGPCAAALSLVGDVARQANGLPKANCAAPPKGDDAKRLVAGQRDLAKTFDRIALSLNDFAARGQAETTGLSGHSDSVNDPALKAKLAEAEEVIEQRHQVTNTFIGDWKKLSTATNQYAVQLDAVFNQGNKALCAQVEKGVQAKSPTDIVASCSKSYDKAKKDVEEKLADIEQGIGGAADAPPAE